MANRCAAAPRRQEHDAADGDAERNKRAVTLNLKSERGRELLKRNGAARRRAAGKFLARHDG